VALGREHKGELVACGGWTRRHWRARCSSEARGGISHRWAQASMATNGLRHWRPHVGSSGDNCTWDLTSGPHAISVVAAVGELERR
jgi:hypothetical protein